MRAKEFITEQRVDTLQADVAAAMPATYVIPKLQNNDAYAQYRFGMAMAGARGQKERARDGIKPMEPASAWGENEIVVSYDPTVEEVIDQALKTVGLQQLMLQIVVEIIYQHKPWKLLLMVVVQPQR